MDSTWLERLQSISSLNFCAEGDFDSYQEKDAPYLDPSWVSKPEVCATIFIATYISVGRDK